MGVIVGAHGVRGLVRVKSFTRDPLSLGAYGPLVDETTGRVFRLVPKNHAGDTLVCALDSVTDRDQALALKGTRLSIDRASLPADALDEDEFYHADLIGLSVECLDGTVLGTVKAVDDFGAGDLLDVTLAGSRRSVMVPFTRAIVPVIDLSLGRVVIDPPEGLLDDPVEKPEAEALAEGDPQ